MLRGMLPCAVALALVSPEVRSQETPLALEPPAWESHRAATQTLVSAAYPKQEAVVSPDGYWIAYSTNGLFDGDPAASQRRTQPAGSRSSAAFPGPGGIFVIPITGGEPRRVTSLERDLRDLAWSPDGSQLSFIARAADDGHARLYLVDVEGGAPVSILGESQYEPTNYVWLADGDIFMTAIAGKRTALFVVSPKTRTIREVDGRTRSGGFSYDMGRSEEIPARLP